MRLFNTAGERIATAVPLHDGLLQVFPIKQTVADVDAWKEIHPSWYCHKVGNHSRFNMLDDAEAEEEDVQEVVPITAFAKRRSAILATFRTGGRPIRSATRWSPKLHPIKCMFADGISVEQVIAAHLAQCDEEGSHWYNCCEQLAGIVWNLSVMNADTILTVLKYLVNAGLWALKRNEDFRANLNFLHAHFLALQADDHPFPTISKADCTKILYTINRIKKAPLH